MSRAIGLFEYLSVAVVNVGLGETRITEADSETYDDDPSGPALLEPARESQTETLVTRVENETYDDDSGLGDLGVAWRSHVETYVTKVDNETVDDTGSCLLSVPML